MDRSDEARPGDAHTDFVPKGILLHLHSNGNRGPEFPPEHHRLGGYETWRPRSSYLEVDASPKIVEQLTKLLQQVKKD